jgi:hypothetical protein
MGICRSMRPTINADSNTRRAFVALLFAGGGCPPAATPKERDTGG